MRRYSVLMMKHNSPTETFMLHNGRLYATRELAHAAAKRCERKTKAVRIETIDARDPAPRSSDAREWDAWRLRGGIAP